MRDILGYLPVLARGCSVASHDKTKACKPNDLMDYNRTLSHNAETKDFARPTSHSVRGWTGKNKAFCSPGTQNGRRVIKVYYPAKWGGISSDTLLTRP